MVQVIAHRGASDDAPEHTLAAFRRAVEIGADAVEADVRLTADGRLVCVHDRRVDRTSDGRGVVSTLELADLAELDFGSWKDPPGRRRGGHRPGHPSGRRPTQPGGRPADELPVTLDDERRSVLTLDALLAYVHDCGRPVEVAIETKHPTRYAGLVERTVVSVLDRFGWAHPRVGTSVPVRVMSFSWLSLRRMHALAPSIPTVYLMERVPLRFRDGSLPVHVGIAGPAIEVVREHPRYVERVHRAGGVVHVWTVDEPDDVDLCLLLGVDAIITNRPADVLSQVRHRPLGAPGQAT